MSRGLDWLMKRNMPAVSMPVTVACICKQRQQQRVRMRVCFDMGEGGKSRLLVPSQVGHAAYGICDASHGAWITGPTIADDLVAAMSMQVDCGIFVQWRPSVPLPVDVL